MNKEDKKIYEKICSHYSFILRYKLFHEEDHLLACETSGYTENYKKVYFKNLQSVKYCSVLPSYIIKMVTNGLFLSLFGAIAIDVGESFILFGIAAIFAIIILVMIIKGTPQAVIFSTAVSEVKIILPNKNKVNQTLKLIAEKKAALKTANNEAEIHEETLLSEIFTSEKKYKI